MRRKHNSFIQGFVLIVMIVFTNVVNLITAIYQLAKYKISHSSNC